MNILNEEASLIRHPTTEVLQQPRPLYWQIFQGMLYLVGSLSFTAGSSMYFTSVFRPAPNAMTAGGWLFVIGSLLFVLADLQEWWDHRLGYCFSYKERQTNDMYLRSLDASVSSNEDDQLKIECNVFGSMCGICFYLAGSIFFIPIFQNYLVIGEWCFIFGSTFCYCSLFWKMYRSACQNPDEKFHFRTLLRDIPTLIMDIFSIIGNLLFFIGTIFFLPYVNLSDVEENWAALFFVIGSSCFVCSSLVLQYTICCSSR